MTCPTWCREKTCRGEHQSQLVQDYIPATAGLPRYSTNGAGITMPRVGIRLSWDEIDHLQPSIGLHIGSEYLDAQADLHLHEAKMLIETLTEAIERLEATAVVP